MTFPLYLLLVPFGIFLVVWLIFFIIALFHILNYGFKSVMTFFSTFIFIAGSVMLIYASYFFIIQIDWTKDVSIDSPVFKNSYQEINFQ